MFMKRAALLFVGLFLVASLGFIQVQTGETRMETPKEKEKQILSILKANYGDSAPSKLEYVPSDLLMKTQKGPDTGLVAEAKEKQVAQGKILNEDNGELLLDSKPCMSK